jgi:hypothetical protein
MRTRRILAEIRDLRVEMRDQRAEAARRDRRTGELIAENKELMAGLRADGADNRELMAGLRADGADNGELMAEIREELALNRAEREQALAFYREARSEMRADAQITREVVRRNERVMSDLVDAVREIKDEARAQTRAIFRLIDRLDGGTATA